MKIITTKTRSTLRKLIQAMKQDGLPNVYSNERTRQKGELWTAISREDVKLSKKIRFNVVNGKAITA